MAMLRRALLVVVIALSSVFAYAQGGALPPLAAVTNGQVTLYGFGGGPQPVIGSSVTPQLNLVWSPNGQHLVFNRFNDNYQLELMLTDSSGSSPVVLAHNVSHLPATFTADSSQVIYAVDVQPGEGASGSAVRILSQGLSPDAEPTPIGEVAFGTGCGGGSPYPMDAVYNLEAGYGGSHLTFTHTDFGILFSTNCAGVGLALLNLENGEATILGNSQTRAELSPDGRQVAAVENGSHIVIIDLATREARPITPQASPDQIAWGANSGTLYYSVRTLLDSPLPLSEEEIQVFRDWLGTDNFVIPQYAVSIHRIDLGSGQVTQVYHEPGWAVGRMFYAQDALYFSLVPNGEAWVEAIATGSIDVTAADSFFRERQTVSVTLLRLVGDAAVEVGTDIGTAQPHPSVVPGG